MVLRHPALGVVCGRLAGRARVYFAEAARAMAECPRASVRPARVMSEVYRRVLERLVARGWSELDRPISFSKPAKLLIALRYGLI